MRGSGGWEMDSCPSGPGPEDTIRSKTVGDCSLRLLPARDAVSERDLGAQPQTATGFGRWQTPVTGPELRLKTRILEVQPQQVM
jgi:hypothetical protein